MVERRFHKSNAGGSIPPVGTFAGVAECLCTSFVMKITEVKFLSPAPILPR